MCSKGNKESENSIDCSKPKSVQRTSSHDISLVTPGAFSYVTQMHNPKPIDAHLTLDLNELKKRYITLKKRQRQAHIIIQTASDQNRLKNSVSTSFSSPNPLTQAQTISTKAPLTILSEGSSIMNHLLIKPSHLDRNIYKKSVQLNTYSTNSIISESSNDEFKKILRTELRKSIEEEITEFKKEKAKTKQLPYYSDDGEETEDEENETVFNEDDDNLRENKPVDQNNNFLKGEEQQITFEEANSLTLLDLANLSVTHKSLAHASLSDVNESTNKSSSSSSSSISSPNLTRGSINKPKTQSVSSQREKLKNQNSFNSSIVIEQLANEEKRQMAPLNPFPNRQMNRNVAKNGIRLGLYKQ